MKGDSEVDDSLSEGEIDESSGEVQRPRFTPSEQLRREEAEVHVQKTKLTHSSYLQPLQPLNQQSLILKSGSVEPFFEAT